MKLPDDAKIIKKLVEKCFKHRCRTVYKNMAIGYEKWTVFNYFINGEGVVSFRIKGSFQQLMITHDAYCKHKEFIDSILLLFPDMMVVRCV